MNLEKGEIRTLWNRDIAAEITDTNLYGSHPFILNVAPDNGTACGFFFLNSNGMDISYLPSDELKFDSLGGIIDLYYIVGRKYIKWKGNYCTI